MATLIGVEAGEDVAECGNLDVGLQDVFLEPFTETGAELDGQASARGSTPSCGSATAGTR